MRTFDLPRTGEKSCSLYKRDPSRVRNACSFVRYRPNLVIAASGIVNALLPTIAPAVNAEVRHGCLKIIVKVLANTIVMGAAPTAPVCPRGDTPVCRAGRRLRFRPRAQGRRMHLRSRPLGARKQQRVHDCEA